ncbi:MAG: response regulator transcription factor [Phycisphaerales bacterium]|nr:MAG: response regulator transcription factor [Phycisphaerales bacterium]
MWILLIEDSAAFAPEVREGLAVQGYRVEVAESHERGREMAADAPYDAIIVEMKMPTQAGVETCRELRRKGVAAPMMIVASPSTIADKVAGLDAGADDYLTVPFALEEMTARLRSLLRRGTAQESDCLTCADLEMDLAKHRVMRAGRIQTLTPKEFKLLEYFLRHQQRVLSRDEIARHVWGASPSGMSNTIDVYVSMLRRKIDKGFRPPLIRTIVGYGYIFGTAEAS